uniref:hypothetical chloroplast RF21 n=1 Tax=Pellia epiphylla TaxID=40340 RepID=UPI00257CFD8D|nr:hypothetical chloroplast RF21 [Pellia epiphylla]WIA67378.1 hypothetical chloroplast RF21 [Pellia epiphylla var. borealis]WIA67463.1 hypothetical chloroplast RF21 [Pellia epiphylla var. borealis]WIA67901.1 hypothetical chloroplast RF21 [Pellia epiphylla]WIA67986.1 hypothetical chloroplast RF21 [Pellia epiphylla]WIA68072.1 hypothetical chloroplast RF21 [Pellia epiphylla]
MKRKLPEKKSSYKNLDLGEMQKTQDLSNSWTRYSLIGLLIALFSNKQHLIELFDFRIVTSLLSRDSHNSVSHKNFVLNTSILLIVPVSMYRLGNKSIVERQNFSLMKIRERIRCGGSISTYKKSLWNFDTGFDIFLRNCLSKDLNHTSSKNLRTGTGDFKWYKFLQGFISNRTNSGTNRIIDEVKKEDVVDSRYYPGFYIDHETIRGSSNNDWDINSIFSDQFPRHGTNNGLDRPVLPPPFGGNSSYKRGFDPNFTDRIPGSFFSPKNLMNYLLWKKEIIQNLWNWGERSSRKINSYYMLFNFRLFLGNHLHNFYKGPGQVLTKKISEYSPLSDGLDSPELFVIMEDTLSDFIYQFSKYILYEVGEGPKISTNRGMEDHPMNRKLGEGGRNTWIDSVDFNEPSNLDESQERGFYTENQIFLIDLVPTYSIFTNRFFSYPKKERDLMRRSLPSGGKYVMNDLFPRHNGIDSSTKLICYTLPELLPIDGSDWNVEIHEDSDGISKNTGDTPKNRMESDAIGMINSWRIHKYYPNLGNHSSPFDPNEQHDFRNERIPYMLREKWLDPLIPSIFYRYRKLNIFINCLGSAGDSVRNESYALVNEYNEIKDPEIEKNIFPIGSEGKAMENYSFFGIKAIIYNFKSIGDMIQIGILDSYHSIRNNSETCFNKSLGIISSLDSWNYTRKNIIHGYSITGKETSCNGVGYNQLTSQVHRWVNRINKFGILYFSKDFAVHNLSVVGLSEISKKFYQDSEGINKILDSLQIFARLYFEKNRLFDRSSEGCINTNLIAMRCFDVEETIKRRNDLFDPTKNNKLCSNCFLRFEDHLSNTQSNYNKIFSLRSVKCSNGNSVPYRQFLKNFWGGGKILSIEFSSAEFIPVAQSQLFNALSLGTTHQNFNGTNLFTDVYGKNIIFYYRYGREKDSFKSFDSEGLVEGCIWTPQLHDTVGIEAYYDMMVYSELLLRNTGKNDEMFVPMNRISPYFRSKYCNERENGIILGGAVRFQHNPFQKFSLFGAYSNYTPWLFTIEWWKYHIYVLVETFQEISSIISYRLKHFIDRDIRVIQKTFGSLWYKTYRELGLAGWNSRPPLNCEEGAISKFIWSDFELLNNWNSLNWAILASVGFFPLSHQNCFSILIGLDSFDSWKYFETIKYLTDTSRAFHLTKLMHGNNTQSNRARNAVIYFFSNLTHHARNIRFYLLTKKSFEEWLISSKNLDFPRRKRNLLVQSLIVHMRIKDYGFRLYSKQKLLSNEFGYRVTHQQGLSYFQYLSEILGEDLINYPFYLADKRLLLASLQEMSQTSRQAIKINPGFQKVPVPLQSVLSRPKGIPLIGPAETGRSYLVKNSAADSYVPPSKISINKLLYNKPDAVTESWMNILMESLRRLNLTLDLAGKMSPCIIWIQNIHQLNVDRSTQDVESDPTFLPGILLKHSQKTTAGIRTGNDTIMVGSTHAPGEVDPALISPNRLDKIINIRSFSNPQRRDQLTILLNGKNFRSVKNPSYSSEFGFRTMGYNIRDLAALANEASLVGVTRDESVIYTDTMKLAFHKQIFGFTHTNNNPKFEQIFGILLYKVGRVIIQNILIKGFATSPLDTSNYSWKRKYYYLSKWYLESPTDESITDELTILTYVSGCLAGVAARDSWLLPEERSDISISLDKLVENDFDSASSISESFFTEFSWLERYDTPIFDREREGSILPIRNLLNINGTVAIGGMIRASNGSRYKSSVSQQKFFSEKTHELVNIAWSPRSWRLSFLRSHSFDWIKRPNDFQSLGGRQFIGERKEQLPYERILPRLRERNIQELESQFEQILLEEQSEILGFSSSSTHYHMEYRLYNETRLFIGGRILWNPVGLLTKIRHLVFSRREFFVDEEMLGRLYVTYGARRERERSRSSQKIKQFLLYRGYNKDLIAKLSVRWWNQLSMDEKQNINTLKRIERIGIQLKRPQIFTPVYLYQRWLIENLPEKFLRFELLNHQRRRLGVTNSSFNDSLTYTTLLESYQYLLRFFPSNKILLNRMIEMLLKNGWLFQDEIEDIIRKSFC